MRQNAHRNAINITQHPGLHNRFRSALRDHFAENEWKPLHVVIGRGGPNLTKGMVYARDILDSLKLPYKIFGYDTSMILTLEYAKRVDDWWGREGKKDFMASLKKRA